MSGSSSRFASSNVEQDRRSTCSFRTSFVLSQRGKNCSYCSHGSPQTLGAVSALELVAASLVARKTTPWSGAEEQGPCDMPRRSPCDSMQSLHVTCDSMQSLHVTCDSMQSLHVTCQM
eukprot:54297-Hanusia_phi.AAC.1